MKKRVVVVVAGFGAALLVGLVVVLARPACWWSGPVCLGIRIGGKVADGPWRGLLAALDKEIANREIEVTVAGVPEAGRRFTLDDLGVAFDDARMTSLAASVGQVGSIFARRAEARRAARGEIDLPMLVSVDVERAHAALLPLKEEADVPPIPARLDLANGGVVPEVPGQFVDLDDAVEKIRRAAESGATSIELQRVAIAPRISKDFLLGIDTHERLARFQTYFSRHGDQELRAHNIETAAARLDGVVLLPHELFSFNTVVGPRTVDNGFTKGWEIFKGEMVEGIGGGTCQAASTLHAVAFLSGLDIIERLPHSRPSAYITMGLDATVVYPIVDLKLRNPYDFPIVIHSYVDGNTVIFELLGRERPAKVTFRREILATRPYTRKVEEKPGVPRDRIIRKQHGIRGYKIKRSRTIAFGDGTARRESNVDVYWPTVELFQVAPGTDPDGKLPPPGADLDESGTSGWATPEAAPAPATDTPLPVAAVQPPAPVDEASAAQETRPKVIEAPGVHAPRAEQLRAPTKLVIGSGAASHR